MITPETLEMLLASGRAFELTSDGGLKVEAPSAPDSRSRKARNQAAYRERKSVTNGNARVTSDNGTVTPGNEVTALATQPAPSPSPPSSPSPLSPTPPIPAPAPTPPSAPPPTGIGTGAREGTGFTLAPHGPLQPPPTQPKRPSKTWEPTAPQIQVAGWFNRRPTTAWSEKEQKAWKALTLEPEDLEILHWFYTESGCRYLRRDLLTLLNNWRGEVDRARNFNPEEGPRA